MAQNNKHNIFDEELDALLKEFETEDLSQNSSFLSKQVDEFSWDEIDKLVDEIGTGQKNSTASMDQKEDWFGNFTDMEITDIEDILNKLDIPQSLHGDGLDALDLSTPSNSLDFENNKDSKTHFQSVNYEQNNPLKKSDGVQEEQLLTKNNQNLNHPEEQSFKQSTPTKKLQFSSTIADNHQVTFRMDENKQESSILSVPSPILKEVEHTVENDRSIVDPSSKLLEKKDNPLKSTTSPALNLPQPSNQINSALPAPMSFTAQLDSGELKKQLEAKKRLQQPFSDPASTSENFTPKQSGVYVSLGIIVTILALIGIIGLGILGVQMMQSFLNKNDLKNEWNQLVYPLVVTDVPEFDNVSALSDKAILSVGVWSFMTKEIDRQRYKRNELGFLMVPALDIEIFIKGVFGSQVPIKHQTLPELNITYETLESEEDKGIYYISLTPASIPYKPNVTTVDTKTNTNQTILTISYMIPVPLMTDEQLFKTGEVAKTMRYYYTTNKDTPPIITKVEAISTDFTSKTPSN